MLNQREVCSRNTYIPESVATLPPFGPIEGQKWFDRISSQWESQKNRFAFISFGKNQFLPPCIWNLPFMSAASGGLDSILHEAAQKFDNTFTHKVLTYIEHHSVLYSMSPRWNWDSAYSVLSRLLYTPSSPISYLSLIVIVICHSKRHKI